MNYLKTEKKLINFAPSLVSLIKLNKFLILLILEQEFELT